MNVNFNAFTAEAQRVAQEVVNIASQLVKTISISNA